MDKTNLHKFISQSIGITIEKAELVSSKYTYIEIQKNEYLFKEKELVENSYVLESGYVRSFTSDENGNDVTTSIFSPFCFVNDALSFFKQIPCSENFQALSDCKLWCMSYEEVQTNFHSIPEFREFGRMMLLTNYASLKQRMLGMIKDKAEVRYLKLMKQHPDIFQHVPLKMIASYLGITDTSLSRIRNDVAGK
jgi:CRP-like cAMP-binding protein